MESKLRIVTALESIANSLSTLAEDTKAKIDIKNLYLFKYSSLFSV